MASVSKTEIAGGATIASAVGTIASVTGTGSTIATSATSIATTILGASNAAKLGAAIATGISSLGVAAPILLVGFGILTYVCAKEEKVF